MIPHWYRTQMRRIPVSTGPKLNLLHFEPGLMMLHALVRGALAEHLK